VAGIQNIALATVPTSLHWVSAAFGVLFLISAVICFVNPTTTFAGLADILGSCSSSVRLTGHRGGWRPGQDR
jgi:uncharacterized membrane protein HdeD (DUF308 family)